MDEIDQRFDAWLAQSPVLDPAAVSMDANLGMAERYERLIGYAQARQARHLARISTHPDPTPVPAKPSARLAAGRDRLAQLSATQEVACLLRWSTGYTIDRMGAATRLVTQLPDTLNAVEGGRFGYLYATSLLTATKDLDAAITAKVEAKVVDHVIPFSEGGPTNATNLGPECKREHHVKHDAGWQLERLPDGTFRWTTPSGRVYDKPPETYPIDQTRPKLEQPEPDQDEPPPF